MTLFNISLKLHLILLLGSYVGDIGRIVVFKHVSFRSHRSAETIWRQCCENL